MKNVQNPLKAPIFQRVTKKSHPTVTNAFSIVVKSNSKVTWKTQK